LLLAISIIAILGAVSIPKYQANAVRNAKETVLKDNLSEMRRMIQLYTKERKKAPQSLQDLVEAGYFRQLPTDPITKSNSSWEPVTDTAVASHDQTNGITNVYSGSSAISSRGTAYNTW